MIRQLPLSGSNAKKPQFEPLEERTLLATVAIWDTASGGNGHAYEFVESSGVTWDDARDAAGAQGYLATITSQAENDFVSDLLVTAASDLNIPNLIEAWLGAEQTNPNGPVDQNWRWVTGEPFTYTNWADIEPNEGRMVGYQPIGVTLTEAMLPSVVEQAIANWAAAGVSPHRVGTLDKVDVHIGRFSDSMLGAADLNTVWLDDDAAGYGWSLHADRDGIDLLLAVTHEFGHILGFDHDEHTVMAPSLRLHANDDLHLTSGVLRRGEVLSGSTLQLNNTAPVSSRKAWFQTVDSVFADVNISMGDQLGDLPEPDTETYVRDIEFRARRHPEHEVNGLLHRGRGMEEEEEEDDAGFNSADGYFASRISDDLRS